MNDESEKVIRDLIGNAEELTFTPGAVDSPRSAQGDNAGRHNLTQTDFLIQIAREAVPFHAPNGTGYADVALDGHRETWAISSDTCCQWLGRRYFEQTDRTPSAEAVRSALEWLEAQAKFKGPKRQVHVRVAQHEGRIYIDLGDVHWHAVEVTAEGWRVIDQPPVRRRPNGMMPLPPPRSGGSVKLLRQFLNVRTESDYVLVVAWLLAAMRGEGPYWVLALSGEQGSAKTTFSKMIRALVDPDSAPLRTLPREERDLYIAARNGHVLAFDNVSLVKPWLSDALCRLSTGGSHASRRLYSNQDEVVISAQSPVILNGIEEVVIRQDLADRTIHLSLDAIPESRRLPDDELWAKFKAVHPLILGALLDAMVYGLKNYSKIDPRTLPRMAACAKFVMACEPAIWPSGTFEKACRQNREEAVQLGIEADLVRTAIVALATQTMQTMQTRISERELPEEITVFEGTASDLLKALRNDFEEFSRKALQPQVLSGRLKRIAPALREWGIIITNDRVGRKQTRMIYIIVDTFKI